MWISRSEEDADGGGGQSTGEGLAKIGMEAEILGDECRRTWNPELILKQVDSEFLLVLVKKLWKQV